MNIKNTIKVALIASSLAFAGQVYAEKTIIWAAGTDAYSFDPHGALSTPNIRVTSKTYDAIVGLTNKGKAIPELATSWSSPTPTTWVFNLRKGVKFHNGEEFTAKDVVFSVKRCMKSDFKPIAPGVTDVKAIDNHTVEITLKAPNPIFDQYILGCGIMSHSWAKEHGVEQAVSQKASDRTQYTTNHANGTGPWILVSRVADKETIWKKNKDWWGYKGNLGPELKKNNADTVPYDRMVFKIIANQATRTAALLSGDVDVVIDPSSQDVDRFNRMPGYKVASVPQARVIFLGMDQARKELRSSNIKGKNPFSDLRVRKAMYQAIDIDTIHKKIMRGHAYITALLVSPSFTGYSKKHDVRHAYDVDQAKKLMAEAGYADGFTVTLDCPNDRYHNDEAICTAVGAMLAKIGIKVSVNARTKNSYFPDLLNGKTDFYFLGWGTPTRDSHWYVATQVKPLPKWNQTGYHNAEVNELVKKSGSEMNMKKRDKMLARIWELYVRDIPTIPLHFQQINFIKKDGVKLGANDGGIPRFVFKED